MSDEVLDDLRPRLRRLQLFAAHNDRDRISYLKARGLPELASINSVGGTDEYFDRLFPKLLCISVKAEAGPGGLRPGLIVLLEQVIKDGEGDPEDREPYEQAVLDYRKWVTRQHEPKGSPLMASDRLLQAAAEIAARRKVGGVPRLRKRRYKIDSDEVLIRFDLKKQLAYLAEHLPYEGLFVLSTAGERTMVEAYVVKRFLQVLKSVHSRELEERQVVLRNNDFAGVEIAEVAYRVVTASYRCSRLVDLLGSPPVDIFLTIWNHDVPLAKLNEVADAFHSRAQQEVGIEIRHTSRIFIVLWANVGETPVETVSTLPTFDSTETDEVLAWFRLCLQDAKVEKADIDLSLIKLQQKLDLNRGVPAGIYQAMRSVIDELRKGRT